MSYNYIIELENNKYYIGKTDQADFNINNGFVSTAQLWTSTFKPIKLLSLVIYNEKFVIRNMKKYGIDNVRGGIFNSFELSIDTVRIINKLISDIDSENISNSDLNEFTNDVLNNSQQLLNIPKKEFFTESIIDKSSESIIDKSTEEYCNCLLSYLRTHKKCIKYYIGY
jgi:hypothetical protein